MSKNTVRNTFRLQVASVCSYMLSKHNMIFCGNGFISEDILDYVPMHKAIEMHNSDSEYKMVEKAKFQFNKRAAQFKCFAHNVKLDEQFVEVVGIESEVVFSGLLRTELVK